LLLMELAGEVEVFGELPNFLRQSPLRANPYFRNPFRWNYIKLLPAKNDEWVEHTLSSFYKDNSTVPALWSGYRSCLTLDKKTQELYRLKGVAWGPKPCWNEELSGIEGGQLLRNACFEKIYSDRFNRTLREEGVDPVMEYVGWYTFPDRVRRRKLATSILCVKGDTRLDELFTVLEFPVMDDFRKKILDVLSGDYPNSIAIADMFDLFCKKARPFYKACGFIVGQLKHLLDKSWQTWSDNPERTNAHIGNVVVYENEERNVALGLVDFDASDDQRDKPKSALRAQQKKEYETIRESALCWPACSYRTIGPVHKRMYPWTRVRENFAQGFAKGYKAPLKKVTNVIPRELLEELIEFSKREVRIADEYANRSLVSSPTT